MKIIISPAKKMNMETDMLSWEHLQNGKRGDGSFSGRTTGRECGRCERI